MTPALAIQSISRSYSRDKLREPKGVVFPYEYYWNIRQKWNQDPRFERIENGSYRTAYLSPSKRFVYKVPLRYTGLICNYFEHDQYRNGTVCKDHVGVPRDALARCRISPAGILVMEFVAGAVYGNYEKVEGTDVDVPDWAWRIEGAQVGINRRGKIVAFDYGNFGY